MNKIICDNQECKQEIKLTKESMETKFLKGGIKINFFRCRSCNTKYLIDVTDKETRQKQTEVRKWAEQRNKALSIVIDDLSKEELERLTMLADECLLNMDRLQAETKESKAELKVKYEGEL